MTTITATRAASTFPVYKPSGAGAAGRAYGSYSFAANPAATTIIELCRVPKGAVVTSGIVFGKSIESSTEAFDADIGWASNGTESADPDGFGNFGVWAAAAVAGTKPETGVRMGFGGVLIGAAGGPQAFSAETIIQLTVVASCAVFTTGTVHCVVDYVVP
jgi:hypothetical protein